MKKPEDIAEEILKIRMEQDFLEGKLQRIGREYVPEYHFLDYKISTFWKCELSPVGMCVYTLDEYCQPTYCRYCGGPVERK